MTTTNPAFPDPVVLPEDPAERLAVGFVRVLRGLGVKVPASATIAFGEALGVVGMAPRSAVYWAGRATLVGRPEDIPVFDAAFAMYWQQRHPETVRVEGEEPPVTLAVDGDDDEQPPDDGEAPPSDDIQTLRFSRVEVLTEKDFSDCTDAELAELTRLMGRLSFTSHQRRSRRQAPTRGRGDRLDLRRTVRTALRHQGEAHTLRHTEASTRPRRLVLLLDVSGSMEAYARGLIRFVHAAVVARNRVEAFTLGTRLTRITRQLSNRDPDAALRRVAPDVADWAGGTRLGDGLAEFNDQWGIRGMARGSVVVILSDGWERGDAGTLGEQMERLHRVTHQVIWVNPLKASPGYEPLAAGMAAALPHVDVFVPGNSFRSLEQLATILSGDDLRRTAA